MRKGYWKILLRRLRGRVASGADTFTFHQAAFTIVAVLASDDDALDPASALPLAVTAGGARFFVDIASNMIGIRTDGACAGETTGLDMPGFIDALTAGANSTSRTNDGGETSGMSLSLDDAEVPEIDLPQRKPVLGD